MNLSPDTYSIIYYIVLILSVLLVYLDANTGLLKKYQKYFKYFHCLFVLFCIFLVGLRPVGDNGFYDTQMYKAMFEYAKEKHEIKHIKDIGFDYLVLFTSYFLNYRGFFLLCSITSFAILFYTGKVINKKWWFLLFLASCSSLYFFDYQVYTIRQGMACAFVLLAFVYDNKYIKFPLLILSVLFHKSLVLPVIAYLICYIIYNETLFYLIMWVISIPLSYFYGAFWENFFAKLLGNDERTVYLTTFSTNYPWLSRSGFRIDILFFNFIFVLIGVYYLWIKKVENKIYKTIFNTYLICSGIVTLVVRANNIHRFVYLAWFLIPVLLFYPLLNNKNIKYKLITQLMLALCCFLIIYKMIKFI